MERNLAVFDFDRTIVNDDSDSTIIKMLSERELPPVWDRSSWTPYMGNIFNLAHAAGFSSTEILDRIGNMAPMPGVIELMNQLHSNNWTIIVLTDANSVFVNHWLVAHDLKEKVCKVITNPAYFDEEGLLHIDPYTNQNVCSRCPKNLCKKQALINYLDNNEFKKKIYMGDGNNDFCPMTLFSESDTIFPRKNFSCARLVEEDKKNLQKSEIKAPHILWDDAFTVINNLFTNKINYEQ